MRLLQMEAPFSVVPRWRVSPRRVVPLSFDPLTSLAASYQELVKTSLH
jgi:hypothetical protein